VCVENSGTAVYIFTRDELVAVGVARYTQ